MSDRKCSHPKQGQNERQWSKTVDGGWFDGVNNGEVVMMLDGT